jgi:O-methyltransferase involved in polyketide biosynthesis
VNHPEVQEMDIALHSLAFMLSHPALGDDQREEIEDVMHQMMQHRDNIEREIDDMEQEAQIGRIGWRSDELRSDEDEQKRQYRQMLRNARWN